jgi:multiple sugar transport system permease protein
MRLESRNLLKGLAFLSPWLIGLTVFTAAPIVLSLYFSVCNYSLLQPPLFIGAANYLHLVHDPVFWKSLENTLYYAALALPAGMIVAIGVALLLNTNLRGRSLYRTLIFLPSLTPVVASAMLWLWLFNAKLGLINVVLEKLGMAHPPGWLVSPRWAMPALALMSLWGVGNTVVIYLAGLQDVPRELYEAADLDGAGALAKTWHVTLPCLSPVIFFNVVMGIIGTLQNFTAPFIMTGGGPVRATYFYSMYLYDNAFRYLRMGYASAMAWVQLLLVLALTGLVFWSAKHWVHYQGR